MASCHHPLPRHSNFLFSTNPGLGEYKGQFKNWGRHGSGRTIYKSGKVEDGVYEDNVLISGTVTIKGTDSPVVFDGCVEGAGWLYKMCGWV